MGSPLCRILTIDKAIEVLAVFIVVRDSNLNVFASQVNDRIPNLVFICFPRQQIQQTIPTDKLLTIIIDDQSGVEVTIVPDLVFQELGDEMIVAEYRIVRIESHQGSIGRFAGRFFVFFGKNTFIKLGSLFLAIPE